VLSEGSLEPLFTRPISAVLALLTLAVVLWGIAPVRRAVAGLFGGRSR
jgi:TctA family transporter